MSAIPTPAALGLLLAQLAVALLSVRLLVEWLRTHTEQARWAMGLLALGLTGAIAALVWLPSSSIPIDAINTLHEGSGRQTIEHLFGRNHHTGPLVHALVGLVEVWGVGDLRDLVRLNLALTSISAAAFAILASAVLRSRAGGLVAMAVVLLSLPTRHAVFSELPTAWITLHLLLGTLATAVALTSARRGMQILALTTLAACAALTLVVRPELFVIGGLGTVTVALQLFRPAWLDGIERAIQRAVHWVRGRSALTVVGVLVALAASTMLIQRYVDGTAQWVAFALHPVNVGAFGLLGFSLIILRPGVVLLFVLGFIHGVRHWRRLGALPIALVITYNLYGAASHGVYFELLRYSTFIAPALFLLAIFGWREWVGHAERCGWKPGWQQLSIALLTLLLLAPPLADSLHYLYPTNQSSQTQEGAEIRLLDRNIQREGRWLLKQITAHPDCTFVAPVTRDQSGSERGLSGWDFLVFGAHIDTPRVAPTGHQSARAAALSVHSDTTCVLLYHGLDCNLAKGPGCATFLPEAKARAETQFGSLPYNDEEEYSARHATIRLAVFPLEH